MEDPQKELGLALAALRAALGLDQADIARAASLPPSSVSEYEGGKTNPSSKTLKRILREGMGLRPNALEAAIGWVRWVRSARRSSDSPPIDVAGTQLGISAGGLAEGVAGLFIPSRRCHKTETGAPALWERLRRYSAEEQRAIVQESTEFWSPILCELLCEESVKAAADRPRRAKELAELALDIAGMVPGNESWRSFSQGYVWAFLGNVRRVQGDLQGADDAFTRSAELRRAGSSASSPEPLSEARLLDLEASLRREQRRLPEALWLLDRALAMSTDEEATARALIKKAKTLEEMDDYVGAVETLREADRILPAGDSRLFLCLRFNLLENLSQTGRFAEALPMLPGVQELAARLGNELDLVRLRWLEARLWAALGRLEEALEALRWVGSEFAARGIAYDAALVTLEAAVLLADEGRTQEVKQLARETAPIFKAQGVGREALATLRLFCQAAEAERLTGTLARHLLKELRRKGSEGGVGETNDA